MCYTLEYYLRTRRKLTRLSHICIRFRNRRQISRLASCGGFSVELPRSSATYFDTRYISRARKYRVLYFRRGLVSLGGMGPVSTDHVAPHGRESARDAFLQCVRRETCAASHVAADNSFNGPCSTQVRQVRPWISRPRVRSRTTSHDSPRVSFLLSPLVIYTKPLVAFIMHSLCAKSHHDSSSKLFV